MAEKITVEVPAGVSPEDAAKAWAAFQKQKMTTKARDLAVRKATKALVDKYRPEYDKLVAGFMPK